MIVTNSVLQNLRTTLSSEFKTAFDAADGISLAKKIATLVPSGSASNTYGWLGKFPQFREWVGDRVLKSIKEASYILQNQKYEATLEVDRSDIEDDNLGQYRTIAQSMGQEGSDFADRKIASLLNKGFTELCYDGQPFFDTEHPVYPSPDGTGEAATISNIHGSESAAGKAWFLLSLNRPLKPFILQQRMAMEFQSITDTQNDTVFMKDKYLYGGRWRGSFGFGLWQQAVVSKEALTASAFEASYAQMQGFKRDGGDPMGIVPSALLVPPSLQSAAEKIVKATTLANGEGNTNYNKVELIISPWLV